MKQITASMINRHTKFNWGLNEFSAHFDVTPDEFKEMFEKTFSGKKRDDLWRKITKNSKKSKPASTTDASPETDSITSTDSSLEIDSILSTNSSSEIDSIVPAETVEVTPAPALTEQHDDSESLEKSREELAMIICSMEENHVALSAQRKSSFEALANHKAWITEYYEALKKHANEVAKLSALTYQLSDEMKNLSSEIAEKREELSLLDEKIALSRKVAILAYSNGEIEIENSKEEIPESWQEIYTIIINDAIADDLKIKEVKQVAKVLAFTKKIGSIGLSFELTFENDVAQRLYDTYTQN